MRFGARLHLSLLISFLPSFVVASSQTAWNFTPTVTGRTLVDALNDDPDYTSLIKLLQTTRLIPTLNRLNGSTLFAPTNDAIKRHASTNSLWRVALDDNPDSFNDNVKEQLRQQLFYHLLNYSISLTQDKPGTQVELTLYFPNKPLDPPSREPPPSPPWMPIPKSTLGDEPQRLRVSARDDHAWVGADAFGKGGAQIVKDQQDAGNGILLGIADVLSTPPDLALLVAQHSKVAYFNRIMTPAIAQLLNSTSELTLFLPVDSAWDSLEFFERLYLESEYATDDLTRILNMHAVVEKHVKYSDSFNPAVNLTTIDGTKLEVVVSSEKTMISNANLVQPDVYASNGVMHLVSDLLFPPGTLQLTPEKSLLVLNCSTFVSLLHSVDLTSLINNTETKITILAPRDDVLSVLGGAELPERGSKELKKLLQYHFLPGKWTPKKLEHGMLIETALVEEGLDGGRQVLGIEVSQEDKKKPSEKSIRFGGAGVIGESIEINNTLIYFISRPLIPPADPLQSALPNLDNSMFLAAIFSTSQAETLRTTPRTSLLIPRNVAFKRLGLLVSAHLLAPSSKQDLENVLLHHALDGVEYAQSLQNGSQHTFATLEGSDLKFDRLKNGTVFIGASGGWASMKAELQTHNLLTNTGVIHEVSDILIPRSVELTIGSLVKAAEGSTMATLVNKAGFDWVLNGTAPPEGSPWADEKLNAAGWTLLCPTDNAFKDYNLTQLYADTEGLRTLVSQHLVSSHKKEDTNLASDSNSWNNNRPLDLDDGGVFATLRSPTSAYGDVLFRRQGEDDKEYVVGIKGARGTDGKTDWARVIAWGRSTTGTGTGGVIQIDKLLIPYQPPWWIEYGGPAAVGTIGIAIICLFFYGVRIIWKRDTTEATYEPVGGFGTDDEP